MTRLLKFLANENFPIASVNILQRKRWDINHVGNTHAGVTDEEVMDLAIAEDRIIEHLTVIMENWYINTVTNQ